MTCRHRPGDPSCSSSPDYVPPYRPGPSPSPDPSSYTVEQVERVGAHLVMRVRYPGCARCEFDSNKVIVFLGVGELEALRWRRIDPHFRAARSKSELEAPPPAARFPATKEGWSDALSYARGKA